jgi:catechol 2,3-dioxygenase-like lactoylglutathione lyase family enzyme
MRPRQASETGTQEAPVPITLDHLIVPARDNGSAAARFAHIMGLDYRGPERHFAPVRVDDALTLDFLTAAGFEGHHLAFRVDGARFEQILARLQALGVPYGNAPEAADNGRTDHPLAPRGLYFVDSDGHLWEVMATE